MHFLSIIAHNADTGRTLKVLNKLYLPKYQVFDLQINRYYSKKLFFLKRENEKVLEGLLCLRVRFAVYS